MRKNSITNRLMSALLAFVMIFGLVPMEAFAAKASDLTNIINEQGYAEKALTFQQKFEARILSRQNGGKAKQMVFWMGRSDDGNNPTYAFCMDHSKPVKSANMTLVVKRDPRIDNNAILHNLYYFGGNAARANAGHRKNIAKLARERAGYQAGDWENMSDNNWSAATQLATWMSLTTASGAPMLCIEGQEGFTDSAYDVIYERDQTDPRALEVLNAAKGLYTLCKWMADQGFDISKRPQGMTNFPMFIHDPICGSYLQPYWQGDSTLDFSSASTDLETGEPNGNVADAYTKMGADGEPAIIKNGDVYEIYWMVQTSTAYNGSVNVTLSGDNIEGAYLQNLSNDEAKALVGDAEGSHWWALTSNEQRGETINIGRTEVIDAGDLYTVNDAKYIQQDLKDDGTFKNDCFPAYFKVCIPAGSIKKGQPQGISISADANIYQYNLFVGEQKDAAGQYQPFMIGDLYAGVDTKGNVVWAGKDILIPPGNPGDPGDPGTPGKPSPPTGVIVKMDTNGRGLGGAVFEFKGVGFDGVTGDRSAKSSASGYVDLQWTNPADKDTYIRPGHYKVKEVEPPPGGYNLDDSGERDITFFEDGTYSGQLFFVNTKKPSLRVRKVDGNTNMGLPGAYFEVWKDGKSLGQIGPSDADGYIEFPALDEEGNQREGLSNGYYEFQEVIPPEGGYLLTTEKKGIHVDLSTLNDRHELEVEDIVFANYKFPVIEIEKKAKENAGQGLDGATFKVSIDGNVLGSYKTEDGGKIKIDYETYARYLDDTKDSWTVRVEEITPPPGYIIDDPNWQEAEMRRGEALATFVFTDSKYPGIKVYKKEAGTDDVNLKGAVFKVTIDGQELGSNFTTGEDGSFTIDYETYARFLDENKDSWTVRVEELVAPDGYLIDNPNWQEIEIKRGQEYAQFTFTDTKYPEIKIRKVDREHPDMGLPGTSFKVAINGVNIEGPLVTDEDGYVTITYEQYKRFLGDINGDSVSKDGWSVTVTELEMPDKYNKDRQEGSEGGDGYTITQHLQPNQSLMEFTFKDTHYRSVKVIKRDSSNTWLLEGAVFTLESINLDHPNEEGTKITREGRTDTNGQFIFEDIPNGTYRITEKIPPTGYEPADPNSQIITVTSMSDRVIEVEFRNAPKEGLLIVKHDAITGKALAGTKFSVRYLGQADASEGTTNDPVEYITDQNGTIYLPDRKAGYYEIRETYVPDGYIIDPEPRIIEIVNKHDSYVVEFKNFQDTQLIVLKEDAETGLPLPGARFTVTTAGGNWIADLVTGPNGYATLQGLKPGSYVIQEVDAPDGHIIDPTPQTFEIVVGQTEPVFKVFKNSSKINLFIRKEDEQTRLPLEGAVFKLSLTNGQVVKPRVVTGKDGLARITDLLPGSYVVEEIEAPQGYILSKNPTQTVVLEAGQTASVLFRNNKRGGIAILKQDAVSGLPLPGAEFDIFDVDNKPIGHYKTGLDGYIRVPDLDQGYYFVQETKAPEGYLLDNTKHQIYVEDFKVTLVELKNYEESTFVVNKVDAQSKVPLAGAKFAIFSMEGTQQGDPFITDASGKASLKNLQPGWYILKELEAPLGYVRNEEEFRIQIIEGKPTSLTVPNTPESGITVHKVDAITKDPLAGAEFELRTHDDQLIGSYTTDASGSFITANVEPGIYYLKETKAPDGYTIAEEMTQVAVKEGEHPIVTIENHKNTTIEIQKVDATTGKYLEGAEFELWTLNCTKLLGTYTTDPSGIVFTEPLPAGNYIVIESKAPDGYIKDEEHHHVQVLYDHPAILKVANNPLTGIMITKLSSVDDQPLIGAKFEIRTAEGELVGEFTTDTTGDPTIAVEPGVYYVKEVKAPDGYLLSDEVHRIEVTAGKIVPLVVRNDPEPSLVIFKGDANTGKGIAGAIFKVETADGDFIGQYTTDAQGEALIRPIKPGHYKVKEMSAPDGYIISEICTKTVTVKVGVVNRVEFMDAEKGSLVVRLEDQKDGHKLENGRFELYWAATGEKMGEGVTDNSGSIVWGNLVPGDYIIKQTYAPDGYTMVDVEIRATVVSGDTKIVVFKDCTAGLVIEKIDRISKETLAGARFQVTRDSDNIVIGEYVTDVDGLALVSGLVPGMYTVEELVAPTGYEIDKKSELVHVKAGEQAHVTFEDTPQAGITINVVDQKTNDPISGIVIEVWRQNGELVNTYTSSTTGVIQTDKLSSGMYVVKVIQTVNGYTAVTNEQIVEIKDGVAVNIKFEFVARGILQIFGLNTEETGLTGMKVKITKIDGTVVGEYTTDVTGIIKVPDLEIGWYVVTVIKAPDGYTSSGETNQNVEITSNGDSIIKFYFGKTYGVQIRTSVSQTNVMVPGVKYQITKLDGSIVGTYTSDATGLLYVELEPGWYVIKQTELPEGYKGYTLCPGRNVEVVAGKPTVVDFILAQLSSMRVKVVDGSTNAPLYGVSLLLKDATGKIVDQYNTNNEGYITLKQTLLDGTYTLTMVTAPNGYTVDPTPKTVEVLNGQTTEIVWKLYNQAGQIQVHLTSSEYNATLDKAAGSNLQGAVFEIYDPFTYVVLATIETDSYGVAASAGLPIGRYIIREKSPAPYYGMSGKETEVYIKINNDVVRVEYQAAPLNLKVGHAMTGIANINAGSFGKFIFTAVNNESSNRLDNFFWNIKVPTDAVRAGTLFTGKWSADVTYSISYKTNMNDYRILAQGLSSASTYQYDLSSLAMSNQGGEYVTDIRFEFGTVPSGFKVVTNPIFYGYVMPTVPNGYMVITRSECGGKHGEVWKTDSALWTTNVINKGGYGGTGPLPNQLPKTGY